MTEHTIIFSGPMVMAILSGAKTQTRRIVKPQPDEDGIAFDLRRRAWFDTSERIYHCPCGVPGDRLWVRETWQQFWAEEIQKGRYTQDGRAGSPSRLPETMRVVYRADGEIPPHHEYGPANWKPSIFMPRWASRLTLEVVNIRVERLREIGGEDAKAEGAEYYVGGHGTVSDSELRMEPGYWHGIAGYQQGFQELWDTINANRAAWETNPWVWVIEFKRLP